MKTRAPVAAAAGDLQESGEGSSRPDQRLGSRPATPPAHS